MGLFFGTDGLRGKVNEDLTFEVAYKVGNALSILKERPTILIGGDTRVSRSYLTAGLAGGAMSGGAKVIDAGVVPTAGIAYLTRLIGAENRLHVFGDDMGLMANGFNDRQNMRGFLEEGKVSIDESPLQR